MAEPRRILFTAVRNEGPFLLEWVAYHRHIGFDRIIVAANDCDDGTTALLEALAAGGILHHLPHKVGPDASPQGQAAGLVNASGLIGDGDWVMWLDADEFLNIHAGAGRLDDLLTAMGAAEGMLIPWRIFGDGGNARFPGRFVDAAFSGAAEPGFRPNATIKTLYRHRDGATRLGQTANHRPRLIDKTRYSAADFLTPAGRPIDADFAINQRWLAGVEGKANFNTAAADFSWDLAQINHYMVRTADVYALKKARGRGFRNIKGGAAQDVARHTDAFFAKNNRNEAPDTSILRHRAGTAAMIERLLEDPAVAKAAAATEAITAERLTAPETAAHAPLPEAMPPDLAAPSAPDTPPVPERRPRRAKPAPTSDAAGPTAPAVTLPRAEHALVTQTYAQAQSILEYGSGGSTLIAAARGHGHTASVESDKGWAKNLRAVLARDFPKADVRVHWQDIGATRAWGHPVGDKGWRKFHRYPLAVWDEPWFRHPDVVLIDGRFRIGCFMAVLLRCSGPVTVLWDDYTPRPEYAVVERYLAPADITGRMARFQVTPLDFPRAEMTEIISWFTKAG